MGGSNQVSAKAAAPAVVRNLSRERASIRVELSLVASAAPDPVTRQANQPLGNTTISAPDPAASPATRPPAIPAAKVISNPAAS